jgi:phosphoglucosamine mutase
MAEAVVAHQADVGLSLDGDADRLIMADEKGRLINGDQCLAVIANLMVARGQLKGNKVVGTLMTNHGLGLYLAKREITLMRTQVGDRYILDALRQQKLNLGGEPSGHILMTDYATSGDGLMTGLVMLSALVESGKPASESLQCFTDTPQVLVNIKADDQDQMTRAIGDPLVVSAMAEAEAELGDDGRVVVRPSGTEPLLRIMVEATQAKTMQKWADTLKDVLEKALRS